MLNSYSVEFESLPVDWSFLTLRRRSLWALNDRYAPNLGRSDCCKIS